MRTVLLFSISFLIFSCGSRLRTNDGKTIRLTGYKTWPDSLILETYEGGGMVNESNSVYISKDSCYIINSNESDGNRYVFKLDAIELDKLFKDILNNSIEQLDTKKTDGIVYDKGTMSLTIRLGKKHVNIADGASEQITEMHKGDFMKTYNLLQSIANQKISGLKRICCFNFDRSLKLPGKCLSIICMTADTSYSDSTFKLKEKICLPLLQGLHSFQIHITQKGKVNYTDYFASIYPKFTFKNDTSFTLKLVNDSLIIQ